MFNIEQIIIALGVMLVINKTTWVIYDASFPLPELKLTYVDHRVVLAAGDI